jgi:hypothetical protein
MLLYYGICLAVKVLSIVYLYYYTIIWSDYWVLLWVPAVGGLLAEGILVPDLKELYFIMRRFFFGEPPLEIKAFELFVFLLCRRDEEEEGCIYLGHGFEAIIFRNGHYDGHYFAEITSI